MSSVPNLVKSQRPALRLVSTKELSRNDWLNVRKSGIGSSDAATAIGINPYQSQLELWMVKTGRDSNLPKVDPQDETSPMYWGSLLEPIVASITPSIQAIESGVLMPFYSTQTQIRRGCWLTSIIRWSVSMRCKY